MNLIAWLIIIAVIIVVIALITLYILNKGRQKTYYHKEGFLDSLDRRYADKWIVPNPMNLLYREKKSPSWFKDKELLK